jgi:hypothetical protein
MPERWQLELNRLKALEPPADLWNEQGKPPLASRLDPTRCAG